MYQKGVPRSNSGALTSDAEFAGRNGKFRCILQFDGFDGAGIVVSLQDFSVC